MPGAEREDKEFLRHRRSVEIGGCHQAQFTVAFLTSLLTCLSGLSASAGAPRAPAPGSGSSLPADARDWLPTVSNSIRVGEYHLSPSSSGNGFAAPNRGHDLRVLWRDGVVEVGPRTDPSDWRLTYRLLGVGRSGVSPFGAVTPVNHQEIDRGRIEWTRNSLRE